MTVAAERLRSGTSTAECDRVRLDLCRMAAGSATSRPVLELARHAQGCPPCATFVDDLARARRWLDECVVPPPAPDVASLAERSRRALLRELAARLARDLHDDAHRVEGRPASQRRDDVRRMLALAGPEALRHDPWRGAIRLALRPAAAASSLQEQARRRAEALRLAARLDPLGLDVALGHLAVLERDGRGRVAHAEADRLLELVG